jgi:hypothetical protein
MFYITKETVYIVLCTICLLAFCFFGYNIAKMSCCTYGQCDISPDRPLDLVRPCELCDYYACKSCCFRLIWLALACLGLAVICFRLAWLCSDLVRFALALILFD